MTDSLQHPKNATLEQNAIIIALGQVPGRHFFVSEIIIVHCKRRIPCSRDRMAMQHKLVLLGDAKAVYKEKCAEHA